MKTLIRFDDICPTMDWHQWNRAEKLLQKYDIKPLLGVIPDCQDPELQIDPPRLDFWKWVKDKQDEGYAIAMHGVYHLYKTKERGLVSNGYNSEFAGLSYEEQIEILLKGKEILKKHGVATDIFFAPSHSYDENTIKALADCGFKYISDGKTLKPVCRHGIICIPCKSRFKGFFIREQYQTEVHHTQNWQYSQLAYGYTKFIKDCQNDNIVDWLEYIDRPNGNLFIQNLYEKYFLFIERNIYPLLGKIKHSLLKLCK